jgi:hypothetical protein
MDMIEWAIEDPLAARLDLEAAMAVRVAVKRARRHGRPVDHQALWPHLAKLVLAASRERCRSPIMQDPVVTETALALGARLEPPRRRRRTRPAHPPEEIPF